MNRLRWADEAISDRDNIYTYVEQRNPAAAARLDMLFKEQATRLTEQPKLVVQAVHQARVNGLCTKIIF